MSQTLGDVTYALLWRSSVITKRYRYAYRTYRLAAALYGMQLIKDKFPLDDMLTTVLTVITISLARLVIGMSRRLVPSRSIKDT